MFNNLISVVVHKQRVDEYTFAEEKSENPEPRLYGAPRTRSGFQHIRSDVATGGIILGVGLALTGLYLGLAASGMHVGSSIHMSILGHPIPPPPTSFWIASAVTQGAGGAILSVGAFNLGRNLIADLSLRRKEYKKMNPQIDEHERFEKAQENWGKPSQE